MNGNHFGTEFRNTEYKMHEINHDRLLHEARRERLLHAAAQQSARRPLRVRVISFIAYVTTLLR